MACVAKMSGLRRLEVNLRHCDQVNNEWMRHLAAALEHTPHLEHLELWVWGCRRVSNEGLSHLMGGMHGC